MQIRWIHQQDNVDSLKLKRDILFRELFSKYCKVFYLAINLVIPVTYS